MKQNFIRPPKRVGDPPESKEFRKRSWVKDITAIIAAIVISGGGTSYYWYQPDSTDAVLQKCITDLQLEVHNLEHQLEDIEEKLDVLLQR